MKLQLENDSSSSQFLGNPELNTDISSENGSKEVTELLRSGIKAAQEGNRAESRDFLLQATELEPNNENAWLWLASISEYPEELLIFLSNVLSINPKNERGLEWEQSTKVLLSKTFVQRGIEASKDSQSEFAKQCFLQAIVHDSRNEMAWLWLASISTAIEEKRAHLQKVLSINPRNETALESLKSVKNQMAGSLLAKAHTAVKADDHQKAAKLLNDILNYSPDLAEAWLLKAFLTDSFSEKAECFDRILSLDPENNAAKTCQAAMQTVIEKTQPANPLVATDAAVEVVESRTDILEIYEPAGEVEEPQVVAAAEAEETQDTPIVSDEADDPVSTASAEVENEALDAAPYYCSDEIADFPTEDLKYEAEPFVRDGSEDSAVQMDESVHIIKELEEFFDAQTEKAEEESFEDEESDMNAAFGADVEESEYQEALSEPVTDAAAAELTEVGSEQAEAVESEQVKFEESAEQFVESEVEEKPEESGEASEEYFAVALEEDEPTEEDKAINLRFSAESSEEEPAVAIEMVPCAFCESENEPQEFICRSCRAVLTLSDLEMLLAHQGADQDMLEKAVERMEIEKSNGDFTSEDLKQLGIAHINLKNLRRAHEYLQEALHLNQNDVLLHSHVNSLAIRIAEIEEKKSIHDSMPQNKTILVVDDSATVRKLISGKLEKCGHEVICAVDGMDALEKINEEIPDLILLDITMPRMDGYQVCKLIRSNEATKEVPVVMISGKDGFFDKVRGRMAGTTGYITKPFGPETLMKTVETYIN